MELDSQTLLFLRTPIAILAAVMVWLFGRAAPDVRGARTWAIATLCVGATGILFSARVNLPYFLTVVVGSTLYIAGAGLFHFGTCRLRNTRYPAVLHIVIALIVILSAWFIFPDLKSDYVARVLVFCPALAFQIFLIVGTLIGHRDLVSREEHKVLAIGAVPFVLLGLGYLWRTVIHVPALAIPPEGILANQTNVHVTYVATLLALMFTPYVFIQINSVRARLQVQDSAHRLRQQAEEWERTFNAVPDLVAIIDMQHRIVRANAAMAKRLGLDPEQCIGRTCHTCVHRSDAPPAICPHVRTLTDGAEHEAEVQEPNLGGDFLVTTTPLRDAAGKLVGSVHIARDITARKQAEEALRLTQASVDGAAEMVAWFTPDGRVRYANDATCRTLGYMRDELLNMTAMDFSPGFTWEQYAEHWREIRRRKSFTLEVTHRRKDGSEYPAEVLVNHVVYCGQEYIFAYGRDITARKAAEEALRESEGRLTSLYASMSEGLASHDMVYAGGSPEDYVITDVNPAFEEITGIAREAAIGRKATELYGTSAAPYLDVYARVAAGGPPEAFEAYFSPMQKHFAISVFSPGKGKFATVFSDITARKQTEAELDRYRRQLEQRVEERTTELCRTVDLVRSERQRFQQALDQLPAYLILLAPDYRVPFANRFFEERFGKAEGRCCYEYLFNRAEPCENCETFTVLKSLQPHRWEWTGPDGRNYDIHDFPFTDVDGSPLIMEVGLDVTERKRAEATVKA
ncbi:MAG TPA: PAS domain-containing protein, partial [Methylomirabilota bacterium]|nr:PAS domain-containing protein [Methylomirabilota bacterium]